MNITEDKIKLIAHKTVKEYTDTLLEKIPDAIKPAIFDALEKRERRLCRLFNIDIEDVDSVRETQKDLNYIRNSRNRSESIISKAMLASIGVCVIAVVNWVLNKVGVS